MFKNYELTLDIATGDARHPLIQVNTNDLDSFKISFIITQHKEPVDLTGKTIRIAILKPDRKTVLQDCTLTDAENGKGEVILDTQAYALGGKHYAEVMVYDGLEKVAVTGRFVYNANRGILNDGTVESTNEWQSINQAIADAENILLDLRENGTGIDAQARQDLESVTAQLAQIEQGKASKTEVAELESSKADKTTVSAQLEAKRDKLTKIELEDLSEETLGAMSGSATFSLESVPQDNSVTPEKAVNLTVTGILAGEPRKIIFDFTNKTLTINSSRINVRGQSYLVNGVVLDFSTFTTNNFYVLYYDFISNSLGGVLQSSTPFNIPNTSVIFGAFNPITKDVMGINSYTIDGNIMSLWDGDYLGFYSGEAHGIDFDFKNNKIKTVQSAGRIIFRNTSYLMPEQTIDLTEVGRYNLVTYNRSNSLIELVPHGQKVKGDSVVFASFDKSKERVFNLENCYVNGALKGQPVDMLSYDYFVLDGKLDGVYTAPTMDDKSDDSTDPLLNKTPEDIYALYDALVSAYPTYISRTQIGADPEETPLYRYDFKPTFPDQETDTPDTIKSKIVVLSGTHGSEKAGAWALYQSMKLICENWMNDEHLETLRWNIHFIIVPMVNPSGWIRNQRKNINGVDLNRQYPTDWVLESDPNKSTYGGTAPLTEPEAIAVNSIIQNEKNILYFCDFHNFSSNPNQNYFLWNAGGSKFSVNLGHHLISKMSRKWKKEHSFLPQDDTTMFGWSSWNPGGSSAREAVANGVQSSTFEICEQFFLEPTPDIFSGLVFQLGVEAFINWLIINIKNNVIVKPKYVNTP